MERRLNLVSDSSFGVSYRKTCKKRAHPHMFLFFFFKTSRVYKKNFASAFLQFLRYYLKELASRIDLLVVLAFYLLFYVSNVSNIAARQRRLRWIALLPPSTAIGTIFYGRVDYVSYSLFILFWVCDS